MPRFSLRQKMRLACLKVGLPYHSSLSADIFCLTASLHARRISSTARWVFPKRRPQTATRNRAFAFHPSE